MATLISLYYKMLETQNVSTRCLRRIPSSLEAEKMSWGELETLSNAFAAELQCRGCLPGDRVMLLFQNSAKLLTCFWGALKCGAVPCVLFPSLGPEGISQRMRLAEANYLVSDIAGDETASFGELRSFKERIFTGEDVTAQDKSFVPPVLTDDSPAFIIFTSGTTGTPKPIVHRHGIGPAILRSMRNVLQVKPEDVYWCTAHPAWITGTVYGLLGPVLCGIESIQYDGAFHAKRWMPVLQDQRVTFWYSAPTAFRSFMREAPAFFAGYDFSALRKICSIGEPLSRDAADWCYQTFGLRPYDTWFQTETGTIRIAAPAGKAPLPGSMGRPVDDAEVLILNESGDEAKSGETGRLCLKRGWESCYIAIYGVSGLSGKMHECYYETGDLAHSDADGNLFFDGRADDVINTSGHLVGPAEIEAALLSFPEIQEAAVIAVPDPLTWQKPAAYLVLAEGTEWNRSLESRLRVCVNHQVSAYAVPKAFRCLEKMPLTLNGKVDRAALKRMAFSDQQII